MRTRLAGLVCIVAFLGACAPSQQEREAVARAQLESAIAQAIKASLKDPDSAKVAVKQVFPLFDGRVACGIVNAKNSFGGYVGDQAFEIPIGPDGGLGQPSIASGDRESALLISICDFQREYGAAPGHAGQKATPEQAKQFKDAYAKRAFEAARQLPPP